MKTQDIIDTANDNANKYTDHFGIPDDMLKEYSGLIDSIREAYKAGFLSGVTYRDEEETE